MQEHQTISLEELRGSPEIVLDRRTAEAMAASEGKRRKRAWWKRVLLTSSAVVAALLLLWVFTPEVFAAVIATGWGCLALLLIPLLIAFYFAPTTLAQERDHPHRDGIFILNAALGWTAWGWLAALIWAASYRPQRP